MDPLQTVNRQIFPVLSFVMLIRQINFAQTIHLHLISRPNQEITP